MYQHLNIIDTNGTLSKPYLHLAIHGMKDEYNNDIEIGTRCGVTCAENVREWLVEGLKESINSVAIDKNFIGDPSKSVHRLGDLKEAHNYPGYGVNFNTIQLEINLNLRRNHRGEIIKILSELILNFCEKFI